MDSQIGSPSMESEPDDGLEGDWHTSVRLSYLPDPIVILESFTLIL